MKLIFVFMIILFTFGCSRFANPEATCEAACYLAFKQQYTTTGIHSKFLGRTPESDIICRCHTREQAVCKDKPVPYTKWIGTIIRNAEAIKIKAEKK